jgi:urease accessory protein
MPIIRATLPTFWAIRPQHAAGRRRAGRLRLRRGLRAGPYAVNTPDRIMLLTRLSPIPLQRTHGQAEIDLVAAAGRTRLARLRQAGSAKAFLPAVHGGPPEIVFLNTAGGLTGGDRIAFSLDLAAGASAIATTQTAERAYASPGGEARIEVRLTLGRDAELDWLPQETILFDHARLSRSTEIDLAPGARCLLTEMIVLGRLASGETLRRLCFHDLRLVRAGGRPVHVDAFALGDTALARAAGAAILADARACAMILLVGPGAAEAAPVLRRLGQEGVEAAVSGWDGKCLIRAVAADPLALRRFVIAALDRLRPGRRLPRVWQI